jgi:hypothetical protein
LAAPFVPARPAILQDLVSIATQAAVRQIDGFLARLTARLRECPQEDAVLAADYLARHGAAFRQTLAAEMAAGLRQAAFTERCMAEQGRSGMPETVSAALSFENMETQILIGILAHALEAAHAETLQSLRMRLATLGVNDCFQPDLFLRIFAAAWDRTGPAGAPSSCLLGRMPANDFLQLGPAYAALLQALATKCIHLPETNRPAMDIARIREQVCLWLTTTGSQAEYARRMAGLIQDMLAGWAHEAALADGVRELLAALHPALLDVALADKDFLAAPAYPGRRLLDAVLQCAVAIPDDGGPTHPAWEMLASLPQRLTADGSGMPLSARLAGLAHEYACRLAEEADAAATAAAPCIAAALRQERTERARHAAATEIAALLEPVEIPGFIGTFLEIQWARALGLAHTLQDSRPDALRHVRKLMQMLVLSVKPDLAPEARKLLPPQLPALLAGLNGWLDLVKWHGPERQNFFALLAAHHAALMRAKGPLASRHRLEMSIDAVQSASERRLNRQAMEEPAADAFVYAVDCLDTGAWLVCDEGNGRRIRSRIVWSSPWRTRFVLTGWNGAQARIYTADVLTQLLREGKAFHIATGTMGSEKV